MKKSWILLFLIIPFMVKSQVPGYQGKRFLLSYNLDVYPNAIDIYNSFLHQSNVPFTVLLAHHINAEYALGPKFSMGTDICYAKSGNYTYNEYATNIDYTYSLSSVKFALNLIFYGNHSPFAPVGNFWKIKLFYGSTQNDAFYVDTFGIKKTYKMSAPLAGIGLSFGTNHIIKNNIVISLSTDADLNLLLPNTSEPIEGYYVALLSNYASLYCMYLKLGVGGLLF